MRLLEHASKMVTSKKKTRHIWQFVVERGWNESQAAANVYFMVFASIPIILFWCDARSGRFIVEKIDKIVENFYSDHHVSTVNYASVSRSNKA